MSKTTILLYKLNTLYEILNEINDFFNFEILNFSSEIELNSFLTDYKKNFYIISKNKLSHISQNQNIVLDDFPIKIFNLIEKLNILTLKNSFSNQSEIFINNYKLDTNSRVLKLKDKKIKLTQKETEMILFIKKYDQGVSIASLKKYVWKHNSNLETHTVETHIYRLRKKIIKSFKDESFILSTENGYKI